jgi:TolA-binding protein
MLIAGGTIRMIATVVIVVIVAGGLWIISGLRADIAVSEENTRKMTEAVSQQQALIARMQADQQQIRDINRELTDTIRNQDRDLDNLRDRFDRSASGDKRDFGAAAAAKPGSLERAVNRGTANAMRCLEIASGAPLTEAEKNATKPSEINRECPALANPNYRAAGGN